MVMSVPQLTSSHTHKHLPPERQPSNPAQATVFDNDKQHQLTAGSTTPYVSSASSRQLPTHATAVPVGGDQHMTHPLPQPQPQTQQSVAAVNYDSIAVLPKKPKRVRVVRLFVFHVLNMCLGALLWTPSVLLTLVSLPLWCKRDDSSSATPLALSKIAETFAKVDIRLANFAVEYLREPRLSIRLSPRLESGHGPTVARVFVYFATIKLMTTLGSFIAVYGTVGTVLLAILSNGTAVGLPHVHVTFAHNPELYLILLLPRFIIGCVCVLRTAPRSVLATKVFCGLRDSEREAAALNAV